MWLVYRFCLWNNSSNYFSNWYFLMQCFIKFNSNKAAVTSELCSSKIQALHIHKSDVGIRSESIKTTVIFLKMWIFLDYWDASRIPQNRMHEQKWLCAVCRQRVGKLCRWSRLFMRSDVCQEIADALQLDYIIICHALEIPRP